MGRTYLAECVPCHVLVHAPEDEPRYACPSCRRRGLTRGLVLVGFSDARHLYGEPGAPWRPPTPAPPKPPRAFVLKCADGHKARSADEVVIDDWLHTNDITHHPEPRLEGMRPDWRVGDTFVEYWGLAGQRGYEERREEKLALYAERGLRLVELFPDDLPRLADKLAPLAARAHLPMPPEARAILPKPRKRTTKGAKKRGKSKKAQKQETLDEA